MTKKAQLNPFLKLALDIGPLMLFFVVNAQARHLLRPPARSWSAVLVALVVSYALISGSAGDDRWFPRSSWWCSAG